MDAFKAENALTALQQKFPSGMPSVNTLSDEQKAWLQMKIQSLADGIRPLLVAERLSKIRNRLVHATEDIPDRELQSMASFVFENMDEIKELINGKEK